MSDAAGSEPAGREQAQAQPAPAEQPDDHRVLPDGTRDETDVGWGERPPYDDDQRLLDERPPHHDRD